MGVSWGARGIAAIMLALCALLAAPAAAGAQTVLSPPGESSSSGANPSRNGQSSEDSVFGPLYEDWMRELPRRPTQQLISAGRIVVATEAADLLGEARAYGLEPRSGAIAWEQTLGPATVVPVAADSGVVVAAAPGGALRAISAADGRVLWARQVPVQEEDGFLTAPVADAGVVYVGAISDSGQYETLYAYALSDGTRLWGTDGPLINTSVSVHGGAPALDRSRVFVVDSCGNAAAVRRADGSFLWQEYSDGDDFFCYGVDAMVAGSTLFGSDGATYSASTGQPRTPLPFDPRASGELLAYGLSDSGGLAAAPVAGGGSVWQRGTGASIDPLLVGGALYSVAGEDLRSLEPSTGKLLLSQPLDETGWFDPVANLAAGTGALLVPSTRGIAALRPILRPTGRRIAFALSAFDVGVGTKVDFVGAVGPELREQRPVILEQIDVAPFGRFETIGRGPAQEDGTVYFSRGIGRNTKVRVRIEGGDATTALVRAYPSYKIAVDRVSDTRGVVTVKVKGIPPSKIAGMRTFAYFGRASQQTFRKLGSARLEGGMRDAQAEIGFRLLRHVGKRDVIAICIRNFVRAGWGRNVGLQKHCGENRVPYPKKKGGKGGKGRIAASRSAGFYASAGQTPDRMRPLGRLPVGELAGRIGLGR